MGNANVPGADVVLTVLGVSVLLFGASVALGFLVPLLYRIPKNRRGGHAFTIAFSNVGFIGFAVADAILGGESVLYIAIYNIIANLAIYSAGVWMVSSTGTVKQSLKDQLIQGAKGLVSPVMLACVVAIILAILRITDSGVIGQTCELIGSMTPAAAMLVIGSTLAKYKVADMLKNGWSWVTSVVRLVVVPVVTYLVAVQFLGPYAALSLMVVAAMPAAMIGVIMSISYGGDTETLSQGMFLSTVLSVVTIPLLIFLLA